MPKLKPNQFILGGFLITEHPALFQTEMVQAISSDRKNQTRRSVKGMALEWLDDSEFTPEFVGDPDNSFCPYGPPGDVLWVKETWSKNSDGSIDFKTDFPFTHPMGGWKPSIHMAKADARFWLMVEDVRVERVQDITEDDAIGEGVERWTDTRLKSQPIRYKVYTNSDPEALYTSSAKDSFETLWISINGEESWDSNPWVWVIKFRILSKTGRPSDETILSNHQQITNN
jgi:hypothetical protein